MGIFKTFWGSLVMLIALMIVLDRAGGFSKVAASVTNFTSSTVKSFKV